jgi:hypothetical protein
MDQSEVQYGKRSMSRVPLLTLSQRTYKTQVFPEVPTLIYLREDGGTLVLCLFEITPNTSNYLELHALLLYFM